MKRQHPIAILRYISKNFWLLLIPLIRGLLAFRFDFYNWLSGAYLDILVVLAIFGTAFFRWWNINFRVSKKGIVIRSGLIFRERAFIPFESVTALTECRTFALRPMRAVTILLDTDSSSAINKHGDPDLKLIIRERDASRIYPFFDSTSDENKEEYRSNRRRMLFFSLAFSSTLSGLIFFGTLLIQGGRLVGNELEERLFGAVNDVTRIAEKIVRGITPLTVGIIIALFAGWTYSFISNYLRHISFSIGRYGRHIRIKSGFFTRWKYYINTDKINCADLRQNMLMKVFRVMSVHISCTGYGKAKNEIPVFVPITKKKDVGSVMRKYLPGFMSETMVRFEVKAAYIMKFLGPPAFLLFSVIIAFSVFMFLMPDWYSVLLFASVMGELAAVHLLIVNLAAFLTGGAFIGERTVTLCYCRAFGFHNVIVPRDKISQIRISQNFLQKFNNSCNFYLYTRGERASCHKVRGLELCDAERAALLLGYSVV